MILQGRMPASEELVNIEVEGESISRVEPSRGETVSDYGGPGSFVCPGFFEDLATLCCVHTHAG